jgi:hypothetical protein
MSLEGHFRHRNDPELVFEFAIDIPFAATAFIFRIR